MKIAHLTALLAAAGGCNALFGLEQGVPSIDDGSADVSPSETTVDSANVDGLSPDTSITDSGTLDTATADVAELPDADADSVVCSTLSPGATEIYVDKRFAGTPNGTVGCPFNTILDAMKLAGPWVGTRTVHVAGSTPTLTYSEVASVFVSKNMVPLGDGSDKATISAPSTTSAAVIVDGGGTLDGFSISSPTGDGILTQSALPPPIVKNVKSVASKNNGITVTGSAELGPNVHFDKNGNCGLFSKSDGTVHVIAPGASFDGNAASGISLDGVATLKFDGGSASNNGVNGLRLAGTSSGGSAVVHTVSALIANGNKAQGLGVFNGQSLKLRTSTLLTTAGGCSVGP